MNLREKNRINLTLDESNIIAYPTIVSAIFVTNQGEYLLQLRDDKIGLPLRNHWALFGGEVEDGEDEYDAIKREMFEELNFHSNNYQWFHEAIYGFPRLNKKIVKKIFYEIPITYAEISFMELYEGAEKKLFKINEIMFLEKISPWDLSTILLHARQKTIFPD